MQLEAQLHHDSIQLHSYALAPPEERLASVLQQHLLGVSWRHSGGLLAQQLNAGLLQQLGLDKAPPIFS